MVLLPHSKEFSHNNYKAMVVHNISTCKANLSSNKDKLSKHLPTLNFSRCCRVWLRNPNRMASLSHNKEFSRNNCKATVEDYIATSRTNHFSNKHSFSRRPMQLNSSTCRKASSHSHLLSRIASLSHNKDNSHNKVNSSRKISSPVNHTMVKRNSTSRATLNSATHTTCNWQQHATLSSNLATPVQNDQ